MQAQVLVVAPIPRLAEEVQRVIAEQFQEQSGRFAVVEADLREAEALVARGGTEGCEVVVSRGGTAELLERLLDIPVVHIQVSLTDILRAVRAAGETGTAHRIGVSGFPNMIYGCAELSELLPLAVEPIEIHNAEEAEEKLRASVAAGVDMAVMLHGRSLSCLRTRMPRSGLRVGRMRAAGLLCDLWARMGEAGRPADGGTGGTGGGRDGGEP